MVDKNIKYDIDKRYIRLNDYVDSETTSEILDALFEMEREKHKDDIDFYINSGGGNTNDFFAIYDVIQSMESKVNTIGLGHCMSAGAFILLSGTGTRKAYRNTRIMVHGVQHWMPYRSHEENRSFWEETEELQKSIENLTTKHTGRSIEYIKKIIERDTYMSAKEALECGIIDEVV